MYTPRYPISGNVSDLLTAIKRRLATVHRSFRRRYGRATTLAYMSPIQAPETLLMCDRRVRNRTTVLLRIRPATLHGNPRDPLRGLTVPTLTASLRVAPLPSDRVPVLQLPFQVLRCETARAVFHKHPLVPRQRQPFTPAAFHVPRSRSRRSELLPVHLLQGWPLHVAFDPHGRHEYCVPLGKERATSLIAWRCTSQWHHPNHT